MLKKIISGKYMWSTCQVLLRWVIDTVNMTLSLPPHRENHFKPATQPIPIKIPNGDIITSSHIALLPQQNLPDKARKAHIFPGLQKPLISIGTLCDNNCITVFNEKRVTIYDKTTRKIVMQGQRDPNTALYMINMAAPLREMTKHNILDTLMANHVYETK